MKAQAILVPENFNFSKHPNVTMLKYKAELEKMANEVVEITSETIGTYTISANNKSLVVPKNYIQKL